jgi:cellulose 1,4-beta-cellobiosidase
MSTLQQLQQSNPTQYTQVTSQIATNLQSAAQTATADGNTSAASQLTQLATDFTNASTSGQLPNIQDLAQAVGGGGHHHHHHFHAESGSSSDSSSGASSTSSTGSTSSTSSTSSSSTSPLDQLLAAFQANSSQNNSFNPMSIIMNTLSTAGITTS